MLPEQSNRLPRRQRRAAWWSPKGRKIKERREKKDAKRLAEEQKCQQNTPANSIDAPCQLPVVSEANSETCELSDNKHPTDQYDNTDLCTRRESEISGSGKAECIAEKELAQQESPTNDVDASCQQETSTNHIDAPDQQQTVIAASLELHDISFDEESFGRYENKDHCTRPDSKKPTVQQEIPTNSIDAPDQQQTVAVAGHEPDELLDKQSVDRYENAVSCTNPKLKKPQCQHSTNSTDEAYQQQTVIVVSSEPQELSFDDGPIERCEGDSREPVRNDSTSATRVQDMNATGLAVINRSIDKHTAEVKKAEEMATCLDILSRSMDKRYRLIPLKDKKPEDIEAQDMKATCKMVIGRSLVKHHLPIATELSESSKPLNWPDSQEGNVGFSTMLVDVSGVPKYAAKN